MSERLEYLRAQIRAECISYGEIIELEELADEIDPGDTELLEWAGVPEFPEDEPLVTIALPQRVWQMVEDVLIDQDRLDDPRYQQALRALRGE